MTTKELREKRAGLADQAAQILKKAHDDKRDVLTSDEDGKWQAFHDDIDKLKRQIDLQERQEEIERSLGEPQARVVEPSQPRSEERSASHAMTRLQRGREDSMRAMRLWLLGSGTSGYRHTSDDLALLDRMGISISAKALEVNWSTMPLRSAFHHDQREWEYRAQGVATGGAGGFTVPDELMRALEVAQLTFGGMRQRSTVIRTETGAALPFPTVNDTAIVGRLLAENTVVTPTDVTFAQLVLDAYKYSSDNVLVSAELLQDNAVNIGGYLGEALGTRIGRISNTHFTTGTGSGQPNGIVTAAPTGFTAPNADSQVTTWKYSSIVETEHSVDPAYRANAAWMMHDSSVKKTKLIVDTTGRPIWAAGIAGAAPDTLMGYPIVVNQAVAVMAASAKSVVFGELGKYLIRDVLGVTLLRLEERYADFHQVAFLAFARMDGDLLNAGTGPVKLFVNAAS